MWIADGWKDYELIDASGGEKLERWGRCIMRRPDPQAVWDTPKSHPLWEKADAVYHRDRSGGGRWEIRSLPGGLSVRYGALRFNIRPTGFKHTGLFPEQAVNWDWEAALIAGAGRPVRVLNLFAYTGGATAACAAAGAQVCHVDASKGMTQWAKENLAASGLSGRPVRFLVDDCIKFVGREKRRGRRYEAIILDPPSYGRGPGGEVWKLEEQLYTLLSACADLLSEKPLFFLLNSYTTGLSPSAMGYLLGVTVGRAFTSGRLEADEIGLNVTSTGLAFPCGASARMTF